MTFHSLFRHDAKYKYVPNPKIPERLHLQKKNEKYSLQSWIIFIFTFNYYLKCMKSFNVYTSTHGGSQGGPRGFGPKF